MDKLKTEYKGISLFGIGATVGAERTLDGTLSLAT